MGKLVEFKTINGLYQGILTAFDPRQGEIIVKSPVKLVTEEFNGV